MVTSFGAALPFWFAALVVVAARTGQTIVMHKLQLDLKDYTEKTAVCANGNTTVRNCIPREMYPESLGARVSRDMDAASVFSSFIALAASVVLSSIPQVVKFSTPLLLLAMVISFGLFVAVWKCDPDKYSNRLSVAGYSYVLMVQIVINVGLGIWALVASGTAAAV